LGGRFIDGKDIDALEPRELELLVCGMADVNVEDWRGHTHYQNGYDDRSRTVQDFWAVVREMSGDQRVRLLEFVTGSSRLPVQGFQGLQGTHGPCPFALYK